MEHEIRFALRGASHTMTFNEKVLNAIRRGYKTAIKNQLLCQFGEFVPQVGLRHLGFTHVVNLNDSNADLSVLPANLQHVIAKANHEDGDLMAERNGNWYFVSSKARNEFTNEGSRNPRFKLDRTRRPVGLALETAAKYGSRFAWISVPVNPDTYSAYFGDYDTVLKLEREYGLVPNAVAMSPGYFRYYEAIAVNERHEIPYVLISNKDERRNR